MAKRGIVPMLSGMLTRSNSELLVLVLLFLMKLAIFKVRLLQSRSSPAGILFQGSAPDCTPQHVYQVERCPD